jgi:hypothetical protein
MAPVVKHVTLVLAGQSKADADLKVKGVTEAITVTATAPAVLETTQVARNFSQEVVSTLPVRRNVRDTVLLAPGVNSNGPNNQISISGAPSYDNLFLVNGVVVNENLRGQPHNLFIEDAIQETTVLTGGISAEYGRFTGGVVSTITKSGGNEFNGTLRDSVTNPKWIAKSDFRDTKGNPEADHPNKNSSIYEGTFGGYAIRDRLWFFGAGRYTKGAPANGFNAQVSTITTNLSFLNTIDEKRYEAKLTGQVTSKQSLVGSYLNVDQTENNNFFPPIYDTPSIVAQRQLPNKLESLSYNGVWTQNFLLEGQASKKNFAFVHSGGIYTDRIRGTWIQDSTARFNAPVFCGVCTNEERNNDTFEVKGSYFLNSKTMGNHTLVAGVERFTEQRIVNNYQSASQFQIISSGTATFVSGNPTPYPHFDSGTQITWRPILELSSGDHLATKSGFVNDRIDLSGRWSLNAGVRFDKNRTIDASGNIVSDDSAYSPRLGVIYDIKGDGRHRVNASYARYTTKIVDGNVGGAANAAGSPAAFTWIYGGAAINALDKNGNIIGTPVAPQDALTALFTWFDSIGGTSATSKLFSSSYPGFTTRILDPIKSPSVDELSVGWGEQLGKTAFVRLDFFNRKWHDFYALHLDPSTGTITQPNGIVGDLAYLINDDTHLERTYNALQTQFAWHPGRWNVGGGYTFARLRGNDGTESDGSASSPNTPGEDYYPEYLNYAARNPVGYITGDQTHRARVWTGYDFTLPFGNLNISAIQGADSGRAYSAIGSIDAAGRNANFKYTGIPVNPGYKFSQIGSLHNYYFSKRGAFRTPSVFSTDLSFNYSLPMIHRTSLFAQAQVLNIFNKSEINNIVNGQLDTTIKTARTDGAAVAGASGPTDSAKIKSGLFPFNPFTDKPKECPQGADAFTCYQMGANWQKGPLFGQGLSKDAYQTPRTYRLSVGVRF